MPGVDSYSLDNYGLDGPGNGDGVVEVTNLNLTRVGDAGVQGINKICDLNKNGKTMITSDIIITNSKNSSGTTTSVRISLIYKAASGSYVEIANLSRVSTSQSSGPYDNYTYLIDVIVDTKTKSLRYVWNNVPQLSSSAHQNETWTANIPSDATEFFLGVISNFSAPISSSNTYSLTGKIAVAQITS